MPKIYTWDQLFSRRQFIKGGLAAAAFGAAAGSGLLQPKPGLGDAQSTVTSTLSGTKYVYTICEQCVWRCGVIARVENGVVRKLEGNPDHPNNAGKLCPRGNAGIETLYSPSRVKFPLIRAGARGSGLWRRASWDEALTYTAGQMKKIKDKYGAKAMIFNSTDNLSQPFFETLLKAYGTPNYGTQRSLCFNSMTTGFLYTYGVAQPGTDYANCNYMIFSGRNLAEGISNIETQEMIDMVARGAKVVVLDPRFTKTAAKAEWLPIRPGTDLAFFLALINVLVNEKLYDVKFVSQYTQGFDELTKEVATYTPQWAEVQTEIPAGTIRRIAREFAASAPAAIAHPNWRTSNFLNSFQAERAIAVLNALVGNWAKPGGLIPDQSINTAKLGTLSHPSYPAAVGMRLDGVPWQFPMVPLAYGVLQVMRDNILTGKPYQAKGWLISRQNPVLSIPERQKTINAIMKLDFIGVIDIMANDTAYYADVILPESSYLERYDGLVPIGDEIFIRQPVIKPLYDTKSSLMIYKELAVKLGLGDFLPYQDEKDLLVQQLKPYTVSLEELERKGHYRVPNFKEDHSKDFAFQTSSGKIEIASGIMAQMGKKAVPTWEAPPKPGPDQFYLLTGKTAQHSQMFTQDNRWLLEIFPENKAWLHTTVARKLGVKTDDEVIIESEVGKIRIKAYVTEGIRPDSVFMVGGFGHVSKGLHFAYGRGASDSALHKSLADPISGSSALSQTFVRVSKA
ncbi:Molybdopterin oxidoreductase Fe4S4 domain protein [Acididesulfobacillus acetoxydans]|uniref:Molybdopterin oxidoreductase Fe4S4 domain protein n=1 Tax=Acididesulfobacillus acetoxydans TaxID=1561005 RepID=A0A8S0W260_9FIRM|nr:molybdopterin-dependent oxidoreductase [Acididesulfobacillus acetoxydans]CAA7600428.1 Molybdopterin oxidoreductase Fe4S4 domain protein [Acididesulfobacillus acetoxydans]CEJ06562.1 Polysulfide reductase chain A [Acididesulfobacillus acetoxydans]